MPKSKAKGRKVLKKPSKITAERWSMMRPTERLPRELDAPAAFRRGLLNTTRMCIKDQIYAPTASGQYNTSYTFQLNDLPSYTDFTSVYEEYRIVKIELSYQCSWNTTDQALQATTVGSSEPAFTNPIFALAFDPNDVTIPASLNTLLQYDNVIQGRMHGEKTFTFYPRPQIVTNSGLYGDSGGPSGKPMWCSSQFAGVQHFGVKVFIANWSLNVPLTTILPQVVIACKYFIQCRGTR